MRANDSLYSVEADWHINTFCNYSCEYCFFSSKREHPSVGSISPHEYLAFFNRTERRWHLHFTGGEPFFYPDFVALCKVLTSCHLVSINSNLSTPHLDEFITDIDPARVDFIHASVHIEERKKHEGFSPLLRKVEQLRSAGFVVFASCVMTHFAFSEFEELQLTFHSLDTPLFPKCLRGFHQGSIFPQSYSTEERQRFSVLSTRAQDLWRRYYGGFEPMINPMLDPNFLDGFPDFHGTMCSAGRDFVTIQSDGTIFRCGNKTVMGSIPGGWLQLSGARRRCDNRTCPYICLRQTQLSPEATTAFPRERSPLLSNSFVRILPAR
jgi:MoaA/NifB/PqqE/SkfB family radical SAM enzyme